MKILEIFGENRQEFIEKCKIIEIWWMSSIGPVKLSNLPAKLCELGPKMKRILKNFKKILRFFDQNLYGKLTFSQILTKYFLDFWLRSESIDLWKITPDFYNNFSDFGRRGTFRRSPPPDATGFVDQDMSLKVFVFFVCSQVLWQKFDLQTNKSTCTSDYTINRMRYCCRRKGNCNIWKFSRNGNYRNPDSWGTQTRACCSCRERSENRATRLVCIDWNWLASAL